MSRTHTADVAIIGAGAAGLMTAIACARQAPRLRVICFDGARTVGAKILVSGGARCNVTNRDVSERDFWGGSPRVVRDVLRAFPAARAVELFAELGVPLHEEPDGKLFPDSNRARTVLDALLAEVGTRRIDLRTSHRVTDIRSMADGFEIETSAGTYRAPHVVLATGGRSLPKSGSDGFGYELARRLGHGHVATTPALAPLLFDDERLQAMAGVAHPVTVSVQSDGVAITRVRGSLLWTHFGASGPAILNASRHWARAVVERRHAEVLINVAPDESFETLEAWIVEESTARPRASVATVLASRLPAAAAAAWTGMAGVGPDTKMAHLSRDERRSLVRALLETRLDVTDTRGYTYAEATAGGVPLEEIDARTMASRVCPGLYLVGEILDVDGRIGGFNFQWAWSSGWVAGSAIARSASVLE